MKNFYISYNEKDEKEKNIKLFVKIRENGKCIKGEWYGDYFVNTYEYNNKIYELWYNEELGIMSKVVERNK